ncbi:MAG: dihydroxy-acid dehydratase, partial [Caulobacteraceae bacterium]|nr:dihydroxy-acid dehydratase [Caulobacteraceae bacterium]
RGLCVGHVGPEAQEGGPIAHVKDGDIIHIDADAGLIDLEVDPVELETRARHWRPRETGYGSGAVWKFAQGVGPASRGAVTHPGMAGERHVYADL